MFQDEAERRAHRNVALTLLGRMIRDLDPGELAELLYDDYGRQEAWAAQKYLEAAEVPEETMDLVRGELAEALAVVTALAGARRTEKWKWQFLSEEGREEGRQEFDSEDEARAAFERLVAREWPPPGTEVRDETDGHVLRRSHPDDDPWVLELRQLTTFTRTVERRDSRHNWPTEPVTTNG